MGVASLVLGILSLVFTFTGSGALIGLIVGIVGIILGTLAKKSAPSGMATAGVVCSIIGTCICVVAFIACAACIGAVSNLAV